MVIIIIILRKRIKFKNNEIIEYPTLDIFAEKKNIKLSYKGEENFAEKKLKLTLYDLSKNNKVIFVILRHQYLL